MAIVTSILSPDPSALSAYRHIVETMTTRILPPGLHGEKEIHISQPLGLLVAVLGRSDQVTSHGNSILTGIMHTDSEKTPWWRLDDPVPEGSYALFRADDSAMEAITDYTGSKTIWHARLGCGGVVVSTCVELIVSLLGNFAMDDRALGWFLSSGTCGPRLSWDKRVTPMPPNSRLRAQKKGMTVTLLETQLDRPKKPEGRVNASQLENELSTTLSQSCYGDKPWILALSGGYDSRAILHGSRHIEDLTCVTWADEFLVDQPNSDLFIARRLAERAGREHVVKIIRRPADASTLERALRRFVQYCDGRVDNYLAYVDGMQMWDELISTSTGRMLRGDELFGTAFASNSAQILQNMRIESFADYASSSEQREMAIRYDHSTPADLLKRSGENVSRWRWRLRSNYEISNVYAGLNSIRSRFTEVACPLLMGHLVRIASSITDRDQSDKVLFKKVVSGMYPDIPFASRSSILRRSDVHAIPQATELVFDHLNSAFARDVLGVQCSRKVSEELMKLGDLGLTMTAKHGIADVKKSSAPVWVKQLKRRFDPGPQLHLPTLGMRSYLAKLLCDEMTETANLGAQALDDINHATA